ncbi:hypothetical protein [Xanthomonas translucens]|uniref:hypothetical protein n=1 Tax=Xanthomonas campestris pv. translucens TaxID=343 RepID=UPI00100830F7|nr:hypothetical protein [Xanthomonas translucens]UKE57709.1 hypothetical protein KFS86_17140 [Xanthomonas translucens pv. hordei]WIH00717.1 hypothetical protein KFS83_17140 [Xanthomonas translucens pv. hordei]
MTAWFKSKFLFSSFGPLYFFLAIGLTVQHNWQSKWNWGFTNSAMVAGWGCLVLSFLIFLQLRTSFEVGSIIRSAISAPERLDESVLSYMLSYLPPLMIDDFGNNAKVIPAAGFYSVLITLMAATNTIYINPYFLIFRIRIFRISLPDGKRVVLISKRNTLKDGESIPLYAINPESLYYSPKDER